MKHSRMRRSCYLFFIGLMAVLLFFQQTAHADPMAPWAEPCAAELATPSATLSSTAQPTLFSHSLFSTHKAKTSSLRLHLPHSFHWPDNSRAPAVITPPESMCRVSLCKKSACTHLLVINVDAFSEESLPVAPETTPDSPLSTSGIFPLWMNSLVSGIRPFIPAVTQKRDFDLLFYDRRPLLPESDTRKDWQGIPEPDWSAFFPSRQADLHTPFHPVSDVYLPEQKQPLFLMLNPLDYKLYWLFWNQANQLNITHWPFSPPLSSTSVSTFASAVENESGLLNPANLTLGLAEQTRLHTLSQENVLLKLEWLGSNQGSFRQFLSILKHMYGDVLRIQKADGTIEYWFRNQQGQLLVITQAELEQRHSIYYESVKADILHRLNTGNPMNGATGIAPAEFQKEHRIVPWSILRQIKTAIDRQAGDKQLDNPPPSDGDTQQSASGQRTAPDHPQAGHQAAQPDTTPGGLVVDWQQRMVAIQSNGEFSGMRDRPAPQEPLLQKQIDEYVYAAKVGFPDEMRTIVSSMETKEELQSLLEGRGTSHPWLTPLQAAVSANQQESINLIKQAADSVDESLFPKLTRADEKYLPKKFRAPETNTRKQANAADLNQTLSFLDTCDIPKHMLQPASSNSRQCSEGRAECAIHKGIFDGCLFLPCCKKTVCESSLLSSMLTSFSDFRLSTLEIIPCPACTQPLNTAEVISQSLDNLRWAWRDTRNSAQGDSLKILSSISAHLTERVAAINQFNNGKTGNAECNTCFAEAECYKFPECVGDACGTCLRCITEYIEVAHTPEGSDILTEKGVLCPNCNAQVPDYAIKLLSGNSALKEITQKANQITASRSLYLISCPCGHLVDTRLFLERKVTCPKCFHLLCRKCRENYHMGECSNTLLLNQLIEDNPQDFKNCPVCHVVVSKDDACNKVTCRDCRASFCWLCLKNISVESYQHFQSTACSLYRRTHPQGQGAVAAPAQNRMLQQCAVCRSPRQLTFLMCGHTCCSGCERNFYATLEKLQYHRQNRCLLCINSIDKQQVELPDLVIPPNAVLRPLTNSKFTIYENDKGYYLVITNSWQRNKKGFYIEKSDCLGHRIFDDPVYWGDDDSYGDSEEEPWFLPGEDEFLPRCSVCNHEGNLNLEGMCGDCQSLFSNSLQTAETQYCDLCGGETRERNEEGYCQTCINTLSESLYLQ